MSDILITGAGGWIGAALARDCQARGLPVLAVSRRAVAGVLQGPELGPHADWAPWLKGAGVVVHAAARVHVMRETVADPLAAFRQTNTVGTLQLAQQAADAGVRRFVFVSSIKVNGESTRPGHPFRADDLPAPEDGYGVSKYEAEQGLHRIAQASGMDVVVVRPPLVYGPGARGNFGSLIRWVGRGLPLPLARVTDNRRSFVSLDNLVDLLVTCIDHPAAAGRTFLAGDGEDLSTAALIARLGVACGRPARMVGVPVALLRTGAAVVGRAGAAQRLLGNLQVDVSPTRQTLGWTPPIDVDEGLRRAARGGGS